MNEIKTIEEWKKQVNEYLNSLNHELQKDEKAIELYYGFEVIDGVLIENPDILFIGINPGAGDKNRNFEIKMETERISYLDIFNTEVEDKYRYPLATNTVKMLEGAGFSEVEIIKLLTERCVKTNLYHIATNNEGDIDNVFKSNPTVKAIDYRNRSSKFCVDLIKIIKPKIVVFEGKSAYNQIIVECYGHSNTWNEQQGFGFLFDHQTKIEYIGYSRTFSNINNCENVSQKIRESGRRGGVNF